MNDWSTYLGDMVEEFPAELSALRNSRKDIGNLFLRYVFCLLLKYLSIQARAITSRFCSYGPTNVAFVELLRVCVWGSHRDSPRNKY